MALKKLLLRSKLDAKKKSLDALRTKDEEFSVREKEIESAINEKTKALYIETLGNPNSDVVDIESITKIAHKHKIPLVVDNTFAS